MNTSSIKDLDVVSMVRIISTHVHTQLSELILSSKIVSQKEHLSHTLSVSRKLLVKLYALVKFFLAQVVSVLSKNRLQDFNLATKFNADINHFREEQLRVFEKATYLARSSAFLETIKAPPYDISTASQILTGGKYPNIPNYLFQEAEILGDYLLNSALLFISPSELIAKRRSKMLELMLLSEINNTHEVVTESDIVILTIGSVFRLELTLSQTFTSWILLKLEFSNSVSNSNQELAKCFSGFQRKYLEDSIRQLLSAPTPPTEAFKTLQLFLNSFMAEVRKKVLRKSVIRLCSTTYHHIFSLQPPSSDENSIFILLFWTNFKAEVFSDGTFLTLQLVSFGAIESFKNIVFTTTQNLINIIISNSERQIHRFLSQTMIALKLDFPEPEFKFLLSNQIYCRIDQQTGTAWLCLNSIPSLGFLPSLFTDNYVQLFASLVKNYIAKVALDGDFTLLENDVSHTDEVFTESRKFRIKEIDELEQKLDFHFDQDIVCSVHLKLTKNLILDVKYALLKNSLLILEKVEIMETTLLHLDLAQVLPIMVKNMRVSVYQFRVNSLHARLMKQDSSVSEINFSEYKGVKALLLHKPAVSLKILIVPTDKNVWEVILQRSGLFEWNFSSLNSLGKHKVKLLGSKIVVNSLEGPNVLSIYINDLEFVNSITFEGNPIGERDILPSPSGVQQLFDSIEGLNHSTVEFPQSSRSPGKGGFLNLLDDYLADSEYKTGISMIDNVLEIILGFGILKHLYVTNSKPSPVRLNFTSALFVSLSIENYELEVYFEEVIRIKSKLHYLHYSFEIMMKSVFQNLLQQLIGVCSKEGMKLDSARLLLDRFLHNLRAYILVAMQLSSAIAKIGSTLSKEKAIKSPKNDPTSLNGNRARGKKSLQLLARQRQNEKDIHVKSEKHEAQQFEFCLISKPVGVVVYSLTQFRLNYPSEQGSTTLRIKISNEDQQLMLIFSGEGKRWPEILHMLSPYTKDRPKQNGKTNLILDLKKKYLVSWTSVVEERVLEKIINILIPSV